MFQLYGLHEGLLIFATSQLLFLALLLAFKRDKNLSDKILMGIFICNALIIGLSYAILSIYHSLIHLFLLQIPIAYLMATLIFIYTKTIVSTISRRDILWFIPSILVLFFIFFNFTILSEEEKRVYLDTFWLNQTATRPLCAFLPRLFFGFIYLPLIIFHSIKTFKLSGHTIFEKIEEKTELAWLQKNIWLMMVTNVAILTALVLDFLSPTIGRLEAFLLILTTNAIAILLLAFYGIGTGQIFRFYTKSEPKKSDLPQRDEHFVLEMKKVEEVMLEEMLFLDPGLRMQDVADKMQISVQELRDILKKGAGVSFSDYLNAFRVDYFLKLHQDAEYDFLSIEGKALKSGFNSKSNFYYIFKKLKGTSPGQLT